MNGAGPAPASCFSRPADDSSGSLGRDHYVWMLLRDDGEQR
jgi:hypothetical protein